MKAEWTLFIGGGKWHGLSEQTHASLVRHMLSVASLAGFRKLSLALAVHEDVNRNVLKKQVADALSEENQVLNNCMLSYDAHITVTPS